MDFKKELFDFENKYKFLYDIEVTGVPIYTCHREVVMKILTSDDEETCTVLEEKSRVYFGRIIEGIVKWLRFKSKNTLIFTSSIYRRDNGKNYAAEWLLNNYENAVIFEWPSRNQEYDQAYFTDSIKEKYCPIDPYLVVYKLYKTIYRKKIKNIYDVEKRKLKSCFEKNSSNRSSREKKAVEYLIEYMPDSYVETMICQNIFRYLFSKYNKVEIVVDFWGGARENIIPVLKNNPKSVELQHGIITNYHTGYIYPPFARNTCGEFFDRQVLVYGKKTKDILLDESIFTNVKVVGNPRINKFMEMNNISNCERKLILFCSQTFEQDGRGTNYYNTVLPMLKRIEKIIEQKWEGFYLGIKLHPRENNGVRELYKENLKNAVVFENTSQLYDLINESYMQITVNSTTLYEAAIFGVPTLTLSYNGICMKDDYGFEVWEAKSEDDLERYFDKLKNKSIYSEYVDYLQEKTKMYM